MQLELLPLLGLGSKCLLFRNPLAEQQQTQALLLLHQPGQIAIPRVSELMQGPLGTRQQPINHDQRPRLGTNAYARHLDAIVRTARGHDVEMVFIISPVPEDLNDNDAAPKLKLYRDAMRHVAERNGVKLVDGPGVFKQSARTADDLFQGNRHLSVQGHRTLSYALSRTLKPWMRGRPLQAKATGVPLAQLAEPGDTQ